MNNQNNKLIKTGLFGCLGLCALYMLFAYIFTWCSLKSWTSDEVTKSESLSTTEELSKAIESNDFATAYNLLAKIKEERGTWEYDDAKKEVVNAEIQYLAVQGTDEANKRLVVLLMEEPINGTARREGQQLGTDKSDFYTEIDHVGYTDNDYGVYVKSCAKFNSRCLQILEMAVATDNQDLAKRMVNLIKPDAEITSKKRGKDMYGDQLYDIYAHYTNHSKDAAQKKYNEHFGSQGQK